MTKLELLRDATDIKIASEALERELKRDYLFWDDKIKHAHAGDPNVPEWRRNAEHARRRRGIEPNASVQALCRLIENELELLPGEVEGRNNYATNAGLAGREWAHYLVYGSR